MLSQEPASQSAEAPQAPVALADLAPHALAERLVEDPAFGPRPGVEQPAPGRAAEQPPPPQGAGPEPEAGGSARDAVGVLSAAVPAPADPTLRIIERLRTRPSSAPAEAMPPPAPVPPLPGQAKAATARPEPGFSVQLLAAGRREQAEQAWNRLKRENPDLLRRLQPIIVEPERKESSLFRLRAGPLATASQAQALCASLTRRRVDCIVVHGG